MVFNLRLISGLARTTSFRWTGSKWLSCSTSLSLWLFKSSFDCDAFLRPRKKTNRDVTISVYCYWQIGKLTATIIVIVCCSCLPLNIYKRPWCEEALPSMSPATCAFWSKLPWIKSGLNKSPAADCAASIKSQFLLDSTPTRERGTWGPPSNPTPFQTRPSTP